MRAWFHWAQRGHGMVLRGRDFGVGPCKSSVCTSEHQALSIFHVYTFILEAFEGMTKLSSSKSSGHWRPLLRSLEPS